MRIKYNPQAYRQVIGDPSKAARLLNRVGVALDATADVPKKSGKLDRGTGYTLVRDGRRIFPLKLWFGSTASYTKDVHEGTRPHEIRPKKAGGVLAWANSQAKGGVSFAKKVQHPGTKSNPYLAQAAISVLGFSRVRKRSSS